jgi:hypothetical protein
MKPKIYKMTYCSNPTSIGMQYVGVRSPLIIAEIFYFSDMYSSNIQSIEHNNDTTIIQTKNTEYHFKEV